MAELLLSKPQEKTDPGKAIGNKPLLPSIFSPQDVKALRADELKLLASEIRGFLIDSLAQTGGHLAPNLGIVELTLSLHKLFDLPKDEIIWDVGHQVYVHKLLTGRRHRFDTLRQYGGLSGFSNREESIYDSFTTGHGGTSISSAFGKACARDLIGGKEHLIAVIGDGAMTEGMALEAINHIGHTQTRLIIILNDNGMSIAPNVGGYSRYFDRVRNEPMFRSGKEYLTHLVKGIPNYGDRMYHLMSKMKDSFKYLLTPGVIFEELGLRYVGPVDGHNISELMEVLGEVKSYNRPVLLHVKTMKGKGFSPAEDTSCKGAKWHGGGPFDKSTGKFIAAGDQRLTYSSIFGNKMIELAQTDKSLCTITAAMPDGTGLSQFATKFPDRFFDVAMAEQHGVTFAAGLASKGLKPFVAIYSTFLQRAYDQIIHDVCLQKLPVRLCLDRGGLVGADGPTHHGVFDYAYLRCLPDLLFMSPRNHEEFDLMLEIMQGHDSGPSAIRYPRGASPDNLPKGSVPLAIGKADKLTDGEDLTIVAIGTMVSHAISVAECLKTEFSIRATVIDARFVKPLDEDLILQEVKRTKHIVTIEEGTVTGGFGSCVLESLSKNGEYPKTLVLGIPDQFVTHGDIQKLYQHIGLDVPSIVKAISTWYLRKDA